MKQDTHHFLIRELGNTQALSPLFERWMYFAVVFDALAKETMAHRAIEQPQMLATAQQSSMPQARQSDKYSVKLQRTWI
ncbi:MAG: hypothetical protein ACPG4N_04565 [Gammaproteobacteria bacterium]